MNTEDLFILLLGVLVLIVFMIAGALASDVLVRWRYNRRVKKNANVHWLKRNETN